MSAEPSAGGTTGGPGSSRALAVVLLVLALALAGGIAWTVVRADAATTAPDGTQTAAAERTRALQAATRLVERTLSTRERGDRETVLAGLTPRFRREYADTLERLSRRSGPRRLQREARVVGRGLQSITGHRARVLMFVDNVTTARAGGRRRPVEVEADRVLVTLTRGDGDWKLDRVEAVPGQLTTPPR